MWSNYMPGRLTLIALGVSDLPVDGLVDGIAQDVLPECAIIILEAVDPLDPVGPVPLHNSSKASTAHHGAGIHDTPCASLHGGCRKLGAGTKMLRQCIVSPRHAVQVSQAELPILFTINQACCGSVSCTHVAMLLHRGVPASSLHMRL